MKQGRSVERGPQYAFLKAGSPFDAMMEIFAQTVNAAAQAQYFPQRRHAADAAAVGIFHATDPCPDIVLVNDFPVILMVAFHVERIPLDVVCAVYDVAVSVHKKQQFALAETMAFG